MDLKYPTPASCEGESFHRRLNQRYLFISHPLADLSSSALQLSQRSMLSRIALRTPSSSDFDPQSSSPLSGQPSEMVITNRRRIYASFMYPEVRAHLSTAPSPSSYIVLLDLIH